jgi:glycosyltransferase involved in cell wall biosynthesis
LGIPVALLPQKKKGVDYFAFLKVAKILREEKIDIIHTHNTQPFMDGTLGGKLACVKTFIHTDHARMFPDKRRYMFAEWVLSQMVDKVVGVSEDTAWNMQKYEKICSKKIMVIPNGVDGRSYSFFLDKQKKRVQLGLPSHGPIIGFGGRLCVQKGLTYLLEAMPGIVRSFPDCTLLIAGTGSLEHELKAQAESLGVTSNVKFLGMRLDMPELLRLFDVFVLSSLSEGLPMVLLEAMAAQCPIVTTNVGGIPSAIKHRGTGLLVEPKKPDDLAAAVIEILKNDDLKNGLVRNAQIDFKKKYDARIMTEKYETLYLQSII